MKRLPRRTRRWVVVACGLSVAGVLQGCAARTADPVADPSSFEAIRMKSRSESQAPEAVRWEQLNAPQMGPALGQISSACSGGATEEAANLPFTLLVRLAKTGDVRQVLVEPQTPFTECYRTRLAAVKFPGAPWDGYWLTILMR